MSVSSVRFRPLVETEITTYWETGEPRDKAGAYAVQGFAAVFIESLGGQLLRRDGAAAVRNVGAAARGQRADPGAQWPHERRNPRQRHSARNARGRPRKRCAAGNLRRAGESSRPRQQSLQGPGVACVAGDAGRFRRHRPGAHRLPARGGHRVHAAGRDHGVPARHRRYPPARESGRRDPRPGHQGSDRHEGRAPHDVRRAPVPLSRVHAAR